MLWLAYAFYGLMFAVGGATFVLLRRAKQARAWIWLVGALVGVAGLAAVAAGHTEGKWRTRALAVMCILFAIDHLLQYVQSRRAAAPRTLHLWLSLAWLLFCAFQLLA